MTKRAARTRIPASDSRVLGPQNSYVVHPENTHTMNSPVMKLIFYIHMSEAMKQEHNTADLRRNMHYKHAMRKCRPNIGVWKLELDACMSI